MKFEIKKNGQELELCVSCGVYHKNGRVIYTLKEACDYLIENGFKEYTPVSDNQKLDNKFSGPTTVFKFMKKKVDTKTTPVIKSSYTKQRVSKKKIKDNIS
jgi:hypothetical protein